MAQALAQGIEKSGGQAKIYYLRDFRIQPCTGCGACFAQADHVCVWEKNDHAAQLFALLEGASPVILTAPIYFYHVPAHLKAFMDRGQKYWAKQGAQGYSLAQEGRPPLHIALVAARKQGDNLFTGTVASLKLFAHLFQRNLGEISLWKGYDGPQEWGQDIKAHEDLQSMGQRIGDSA